MEFERVFTETPKMSLWHRMDILTTFQGVKTELRSKDFSISDELLEEKAKGIAFCIRSARDLFSISNSSNLTPSLTAIYYGTYNLLSALILSDLNNEYTLNNIEKLSKNGGHGLKSIYTETTNDISNSEFIYISSNGFFKEVLKYFKYDFEKISFAKNIKSLDNLTIEEKQNLISFEDLASRIPELKNIYVEIFKKQPNYIGYSGWYSNYPDKTQLKIKVYKSNNSEYLKDNDINEILGIPKEYKFEFKPENSGESSPMCFICENVPNSYISMESEYNSVIANSCNIKPLLSIKEPILFYFQILYMLSIWTRYRPNLWRQINEGELEQYRSLFKILTESAERIIPNIFLNKFYNRNILFAGHSYYS